VFTPTLEASGAERTDSVAIAERILHLHRLEDIRPDEALIRAAQEGEREAASALVERYYPRVRSFVSYLTNGRSNAEDLTQEVFARALSALGRFNGNYRFEPWLLRIAKNLVIDEARRRVHLPEATDPSELPEIEPVPVSLDNVWDSIAQQMSSSTVNAALERLPLRQRTVLVLREIEEMAYADIAQVVGTNIRGVEATLRRARARFRIEVANLETDEAHAAVCRRTLRLVASDGAQVSGEASAHLVRCPDCRSKASTARRADRLFTMLPPIALGVPSWRGKVVAGFSERALRATSRGGQLLELVRGGVAQVVSLPIAQIMEVAATIAIAAVVTTSGRPVQGPVRITDTPASSEQQFVQDASAQVDGSAQGGVAPAAGGDDEGQPDPAVATDPAAPADPTVAGLVPGSSDPLGLGGLLGGGLLPSAEDLLRDPVGTLNGVVNNLPSTIASTVDDVTGVIDGTLDNPVGTVRETVEGVASAVKDAPVAKQVTSKLPLKKLAPRR
jgi:RNA polymerase sigma-70 factor, ECF subfamily